MKDKEITKLEKALGKAEEKIYHLEAANAILLDRYHELKSEFIGLKNGYDTKKVLPENNLVVLVRLIQNGEIIKAWRSSGKNMWQNHENGEDIYNELVDRFWYLPYFD